MLGLIKKGLGFFIALLGMVLLGLLVLGLITQVISNWGTTPSEQQETEMVHNDIRINSCIHTFIICTVENFLINNCLSATTNFSCTTNNLC